MEKLSSIGEFITELVHELNNPLAAIKLQTELALMSGNFEDAEKQFQVILRNSDKMLKLLERFRSMAYKSKDEFQIFDLNDCLREVCETVHILKPKTLSLLTKFTSDRLRIRGDKYQINQVILNLSKNAFDAVTGENPCLRIESRKITATQIRRTKGAVKVHCLARDKWAKLLDQVKKFALIKISDNGVGIGKKTLESIFEPFFTTKERGKGTGLGLSISKDIALRHGGNLSLRSTPGKGTTFQFYIPLAPE
jgi:signal transduction histidine kinase